MKSGGGGMTGLVRLASWKMRERGESLAERGHGAGAGAKAGNGAGLPALHADGQQRANGSSAGMPLDDSAAGSNSVSESSGTRGNEGSESFAARIPSAPTQETFAAVLARRMTASKDAAPVPGTPGVPPSASSNMSPGVVSNDGVASDNDVAAVSMTAVSTATTGVPTSLDLFPRTAPSKDQRIDAQPLAPSVAGALTRRADQPHVIGAAAKPASVENGSHAFVSMNFGPVDLAMEERAPVKFASPKLAQDFALRDLASQEIAFTDQTNAIDVNAESDTTLPFHEGRMPKAFPQAVVASAIVPSVTTEVAVAPAGDSTSGAHHASDHRSVGERHDSAQGSWKGVTQQSAAPGPVRWRDAALIIAEPTPSARRHADASPSSLSADGPSGAALEGVSRDHESVHQDVHQDDCENVRPGSRGGLDQGVQNGVQNGADEGQLPRPLLAARGVPHPDARSVDRSPDHANLGAPAYRSMPRQESPAYPLATPTRLASALPASPASDASTHALSLPSAPRTWPTHALLMSQGKRSGDDVPAEGLSPSLDQKVPPQEASLELSPPPALSAHTSPTHAHSAHFALAVDPSAQASPGLRSSHVGAPVVDARDGQSHPARSPGDLASAAPHPFFVTRRAADKGGVVQKSRATNLPLAPTADATAPFASVHRSDLAAPASPFALPAVTDGVPRRTRPQDQTRPPASPTSPDQPVSAHHAAAFASLFPGLTPPRSGHATPTSEGSRAVQGAGRVVGSEVVRAAAPGRSGGSSADSERRRSTDLRPSAPDASPSRAAVPSQSPSDRSPLLVPVLAASDMATAVAAQLAVVPALLTMPLPVLPGEAGRRVLDLATDDPSLHAAAIGANAHLTLDTGGAGEVSLHLRVRDGVADVRVEGPAAHLLDMRPAEVRTALAGEGISLGRFETGVAPPTVDSPSTSTSSVPAPDHRAALGSGTSAGSGFGSPSHDGRPQWNLDDRASDAPRGQPRAPTPDRGAAISDTAASSSGDPSRARRRLHVTV